MSMETLQAFPFLALDRESVTSLGALRMPSACSRGTSPYLTASITLKSRLNHASKPEKSINIDRHVHFGSKTRINLSIRRPLSFLVMISSGVMMCTTPPQPAKQSRSTPERRHLAREVHAAPRAPLGEGLEQLIFVHTCMKTYENHLKTY